MLEFEASYLAFESLFKNFASDMTICNTPSLPPCRVISSKFYIRAEFLDTKLLVFTLPKASRANTKNAKTYLW